VARVFAPPGFLPKWEKQKAEMLKAEIHFYFLLSAF
jgi:hypothetical protein